MDLTYSHICERNNEFHKEDLLPIWSSVYVCMYVCGGVGVGGCLILSRRGQYCICGLPAAMTFQEPKTIKRQVILKHWFSYFLKKICMSKISRQQESQRPVLS